MEQEGKETIMVDASCEERKAGIPGSTLKIIAVVTMLIDHIGAALLNRLLILQVYKNGMYSEALYDFYFGLRMIGRLGFPIFCFLLVEGFQKTRNLGKYILRLILFALLSEIPFNLAFAGSLSAIGNQNVYFTLLLGMLAITVISKLETLPGEPEKKWLKSALFVGGSAIAIVYCIRIINYLLQISVADYEGFQILVPFLSYVAPAVFILVVVALCMDQFWKTMGAIGVAFFFMMAANFLRTDYSALGVATIVIMYLLRKNRANSYFWGTLCLCVSNYAEIPALLALFAVQKYNGERGLKMKYFFYAFYPVHLALLWLIALILGMDSISVF